MLDRQEKLGRALHEHLAHIVRTYRPVCEVCGEAVLHEEGKFNMIGTDPRGPRLMGSLKCGNCGRVTFSRCRTTTDFREHVEFGTGHVVSSEPAPILRLN